LLPYHDLGEKVLHIVPPGLRPWCLPVAAFLGGLVATIVVYRIAAREGVTLVGTLLLAGIAINALASAGIGMLVFVADEQQLRTLIFWTMGGFGAVTWAAIAPALLVLAISIPTLLPSAHLLDALALGEREAGHIGVDVERLKRRLVAQVALAVGAGVAISGIVGFVGLIAPHIVRRCWGPDTAPCCPPRRCSAALSWSWPTHWRAPWSRPPNCRSAFLTAWSADPSSLAARGPRRTETCERAASHRGRSQGPRQVLIRDISLEVRPRDSPRRHRPSTAPARARS
jgi:hypothetical protein